MTKLGTVNNPDVPVVIQDHEERIRALEASVQLVGTTFVFPSPANFSNPDVAVVGAGILLLYTIDTTESDVAVHGWLYDQDTNPDGTEEPLLEIPGPRNLGANTPQAVQFDTGLAFRLVTGNSGPVDGDLVSPDFSVILTLGFAA